MFVLGIKQTGRAHEGDSEGDDVLVLDLEAGYTDVCKNLRRYILNDLSTFMTIYFSMKYI